MMLSVCVCVCVVSFLGNAYLTLYPEYFMSTTHRETTTFLLSPAFQICHRIHLTEHPHAEKKKTKQKKQEVSDASWEWRRRLKDLWEEIRTNLISQQI